VDTLLSRAALRVLSGLAVIAVSLLSSAQPREPARRVLLFDEIVKVPRSQWRALTVSLKQRPARVEVEQQVLDTGAQVRVLLMTRADVDRFREGQSHRVLASTPYGRKGMLRHLVTRPGDYMVLLDNTSDSRSPAVVGLKVGLVYEPEHVSFDPRVLAPARRRAVVAVSLLGFALIAAWSGWRLWKSGFSPRGG
jgi:hypothetical protein